MEPVLRKAVIKSECSVSSSQSQWQRSSPGIQSHGLLTWLIPVVLDVVLPSRVSLPSSRSRCSGQCSKHGPTSMRMRNLSRSTGAFRDKVNNFDRRGSWTPPQRPPHRKDNSATGRRNRTPQRPRRRPQNAQNALDALECHPSCMFASVAAQASLNLGSR